MTARHTLFFVCLLVAGAALAGCRRETSGQPSGDGVQFGQGNVAVEARDQPVRDGAVVIDRVEIDRDGWVVVHVNQNGGPGEVLGQTQVTAGLSENVRVAIDVSRATPQLLVTLYEDSGNIGTFEFPQADPPVLGASGPPMATFTVELP